jgi:hypothetical protein
MFFSHRNSQIVSQFRMQILRLCKSKSSTYVRWDPPNSKFGSLKGDNFDRFVSYALCVYIYTERERLHFSYYTRVCVCLILLQFGSSDPNLIIERCSPEVWSGSTPHTILLPKDMVDGSRGFRPKQTCHTLESKRSEEDKQLIDMSSCARQTRKIWGSGVPRSMWKRWSIGPSFPSNLQLGDSVILIFISTKSSKLYTALYIYIYLFIYFWFSNILQYFITLHLSSSFIFIPTRL